MPEDTGPSIKVYGAARQVFSRRKQGYPMHYCSADGYSRVRLTLATHKIGGLSRNDFILAAKIDRLIEDAVRT